MATLENTDTPAAAPATTPAPPPASTSATASSASSSSPSAAAAAAPSIPNLLALRDRIPKLQPRRRAPPPANPTPVPPTPPLPSPAAILRGDDNDNDATEPPAPHVFIAPRRRIVSPEDHALFLASPACTLLEAWVFGLADAVVDTPAGVFADALADAGGGLSAAAQSGDGTASRHTAAFPPAPEPPHFQKTTLPQRPLSAAVRGLLAVLDAVAALVYAHPPDGDVAPEEAVAAADHGGGDGGGAPVASSRFGNKRFRGFVDDVRRHAPQWHRTLLGMDGGGHGTDNAAAVAETATYLAHAFGNRARIDYGSGHELHFFVWLLCLYAQGVVAAADRAALALVVFARYLDVLRLVQQTYYLEPAGSHGVWGLDDYQFCPFLFGAAQLRGHRFLTPRAVHQPLTLEQFGDDYLYLGQVRFVNSIKVATAPDAPASSSSSSAATSSLRWHSPMLDDISAAKSWAKIDDGMRRMFRAEILQKLPVMQHFLFGSLVRAAPGMTPIAEDAASAAGGAGAGAGAGAETVAPADAASDNDDDDDDMDGAGGTVKVFQEGGVRHIHNSSGWGDCCGIRVPSSLGAAGELRKHSRTTALRRIPFD